MHIRYLNIIRRWRWILVAVPLAIALAALALSKLTTPVYEASLTLWVSQASSAAGQQYADILAAERLAKTYGALITKRPVLQETIDNLGLKVIAMAPVRVGSDLTHRGCKCNGIAAPGFSAP